MKTYLVSLGIGLNMFFQDYYVIGSPENENSWSEQLKANYRFINWNKGKES